jgi:hypothetical protein
MVLLLPFNMYFAPERSGIGDNNIDTILGQRQFARDMQAGVPLSELLANYAPVIGYGLDRETLVRFHRNQVGPFRYLREDPPLQEEVLVPEAVAENSRISFSSSRVVYGIRLEYSSTDPEAPRPVLVKVFWQRPGRTDWVGARENDQRYLPYLDGKQVFVVWIEDHITDLRLDWGAYANSIDLTVTLLVPAGS